MWGAIAINYLDRTNLSAAAPQIMKEFNLNPAEMGFIMSAFFWIYLLCQIPAGWVADRIGQRITYAVAVTWWSAATVLTIAGTNLATFMGIRGLLGVGESAAFPCNSGVTAKWFPDNERARASAIFDSGTKVGTALAMPLIVWLMTLYGWKMPFVVSGLIGFVWVGLWWMYYTDPEKSRYANAAELAYIRDGQAKKEGLGDTKAPLKWYQLFRYRNIQAMCLGLFLLNYAIYFFITWFPTYLVQERGMKMMTMGFVAMIPPLTGLVTELIGGCFSDWLYMRGHSLTFARKVNLVAGMLLATSVALAGLVDSAAMCIFLLSVSYGGLVFAASAIWSLPGDVAPRNMTSMVGGMQAAVSNLGGVVGPIVTGYIVMSTHSFIPALILSGAATLLGALTYLFYLGKIEPIKVD
jgi:D-galactonate transporter